MVLLIAACGGGGGGYTASCLGTSEGCVSRVPTEARGDDPRNPSDDRGDSLDRVPSEGRGGGSHNPIGGRGDEGDRTPAEGRGNSAVSTGTRTSSLPQIQDVSYKSLGKELGLSYADFGTYISKDTSQSDAYFSGAFISGNEEYKIFIKDIKQDLVFKGRAVGNASSDTEMIELDGPAELIFNKATGVSTLGASFDNWYDIQVRDDEKGVIEFSNYKNDNGIMKIDSEDKIITDGAKMEVGYFGGSQVPTEAAGRVEFEDRDIKMDISFGVK